MTAPAIGRAVWYFGLWDPGMLSAEQPCAATITYVWGPSMVNLRYLDHTGAEHVAFSIPLRAYRSDDKHGNGSPVAVWPVFTPG